MKKVIAILITFWFLCLLILGTLPTNPLLGAVFLIYTIYLPLIITLVWVANTTQGKLLIEKLKVWHIAVISSWFVFLYLVYSHQWASETLNKIFFIDAKNLEITYTLLTFLFVPVEVIYNQSFLEVLLSVITALIIIVPLPAMLLIPLLSEQPIRYLKTIGKVFLIAVLVSSFLRIIFLTSINQETLIKNFALWADFNSHHLCSDNWAKESDKVLSLGNDRFLAHFPKNTKEHEFLLKKCNNFRESKPTVTP